MFCFNLLADQELILYVHENQEPAICSILTVFGCIL